MEPILYGSISGGKSNFKRQEIAANNLANINTPGFRADLYQAKSMAMTDANGNKIGGSHTFVAQGQNAVDLRKGEIMTTGRDLDVAIDGEGWLAVDAGNGKEGYVRGGSLRLDATGQLTTAGGLPVLGDGGPIGIPPARSIEIGRDGTISVVPLDGDAKVMAVVGRLKLVSIDKQNVVKNERGLVQTRNGAPLPADSEVKVLPGALEGSNVNAIDQMVSMISASREFDAHMNLLSTVDRISEKLEHILQV